MIAFEPNSAVSFAEGWGVFASDGRRPYRIEADAETGLIPNDDAAWRLLVQRASYGSAHHLQTLDWLRRESPEEFWAIARFTKLQVEPTVDELKAALSTLLDAYTEHDQVLDGFLDDSGSQQERQE